MFWTNFFEKFKKSFFLFFKKKQIDIKNMGEEEEEEFYIKVGDKYLFSRCTYDDFYPFNALKDTIEEASVYILKAKTLFVRVNGQNMNWHSLRHMYINPTNNYLNADINNVPCVLYSVYDEIHLYACHEKAGNRLPCVAEFKRLYLLK
jgi:hypothetical protein